MKWKARKRLELVTDVFSTHQISVNHTYASMLLSLRTMEAGPLMAKGFLVLVIMSLAVQGTRSSEFLREYVRTQNSLSQAERSLLTELPVPNGVLERRIRLRSRLNTHLIYKK